MSQTVFQTIPVSKKKALYTRMWGSEGFSGAFPTVKTWYRGAGSKNSYTFSGIYDENHAVDEDTCRERLADLFGIPNDEIAVFEKKFTQSCSGSGKEGDRIATLHSSSLCALLFFYSVSKKYPYRIESDGKKYKFTYSRFEYQNTVIEGRDPSNIDVVLIGEEEGSRKPAVLFLESKFSEYYTATGRKLKISAAYLKNKYGKVLYGKASMDRLGFRTETQEGSDHFFLRSDTPCYLTGIKQMISHYIGVRNLCDAPDPKKDKVSCVIAAGAKVLLGEILFADRIGQLPIEKNKDCFTAYQEKHGILAELLNEQLEKDDLRGTFTVLPKLLTYEQANLHVPKIKQFYFESGT